jgi:trimeric autotransporter adhesin
MNTRPRPRLLIVLSVLSSAPAAAQSSILLELQSGTPPGDRLSVDSAGGAVLLGALNRGSIPVQNAGVRLMWYPAKAAFRAGIVDGVQWNDAQVGLYSVGLGFNSTASGIASTALGQATASGGASTAMGLLTIASGYASVAMGDLSQASGYAALASGAGTLASGWYATAMGSLATASGMSSAAIGRGVTAAGAGAVALGGRARAQHAGAFVWGDLNPDVQEDSVASQANREFRARARGGFRLRTTLAANAAPGVSGNNGCDLSTGGGSWVCGSSRTLKENFLAVDGEELLRRVRATPVSSWNYVEEEGRPRHLGPMAEDFHQAFGLGDTPTGIGHLDIAGVTFAGVQALEVRTAEQAEAIRALSAENAALRNRLARLERLMEGLLDPP